MPMRTGDSARSSREIEITYLWFETNPPVHILNPDRPLPTRLRLDETFETWVPVAALPNVPNVERLGRVSLSNGKVVKSRLNSAVPPVGNVAGPGSPQGQVGWGSSLPRLPTDIPVARGADNLQTSDSFQPLSLLEAGGRWSRMEEPVHGILGRDAELAQVTHFIGSVPGGPSALILEGAAGIGKTTLWRAGVSFARARGHRVLSCCAAESEARLSYAALGDLFDFELPDLPAPQKRALDAALLRAEVEGAAPDQRAVWLHRWEFCAPWPHPVR
jgi:AAA ATPase domain